VQPTPTPTPEPTPTPIDLSLVEPLPILRGPTETPGLTPAPVATDGLATAGTDPAPANATLRVIDAPAPQGLLETIAGGIISALFGG
jgi:hypothetical protein